MDECKVKKKLFSLKIKGHNSSSEKVIRSDIKLALCFMVTDESNFIWFALGELKSLSGHHM